MSHVCRHSQFTIWYLSSLSPSSSIPKLEFGFKQDRNTTPLGSLRRFHVCRRRVAWSRKSPPPSQTQVPSPPLSSLPRPVSGATSLPSRLSDRHLLQLVAAPPLPALLRPTSPLPDTRRGVHCTEPSLLLLLRSVPPSPSTEACRCLRRGTPSVGVLVQPLPGSKPSFVGSSGSLGSQHRRLAISLLTVSFPVSASTLSPAIENTSGRLLAVSRHLRSRAASCPSRPRVLSPVFPSMNTHLNITHKVLSKLRRLPMFRAHNPNIPSLYHILQFNASMSNLKVVWRKDLKLDQAIENDKKWRLCYRVVREVLNEPGQVIPLRYLAKRHERLRLPIKLEEFLSQNPGLFDIYKDRIRPKSNLVPFVRPSDRLNRFLEEEKLVYNNNEPFIVAKLCKLLMMAKNRVVSAEKLVEVKREFGFPNDFLVRIVSAHPEYFRLHGLPGQGQSYLELVSCNKEFGKSVIERRAEEESKLMGINVRPAFEWKLPPGFFFKKGMREWVRDWMELPYISPYEDVSHLDPASPEMEKRMVGVFHELLSLSIYKRVPVPILGKFCEDFRYSNGFTSVFTRHSGIFYMSLKGGIQTAMLREAYKGEELVDLDPLCEIKNKFVEMLEEGWRERAEKLRIRRESIGKDMEILAARNKELKCDEQNTEI
ncbi:protein WHAT'S THIS FACTOR 1, chloroplastic-like [Salvia divinorum]|uniref:Protein WHAT'S THIS FACTOR 1, chloroplastic-like n=1 Tax=Salvia divinorum TaxID=28513 RepID=A0ABD1G9E0_SALDI